MMERCICGAAMRDIMASANVDLPPEDQRHVWTHVHGSDTRCTDPRRIADMMPDRDMIQSTAKLMAELKNHTRRASGELENVAAAVAELSEDLAALRSSLDNPEAVRRATLLEVWGLLADLGDLAGARMVRDMLRGDKS